MVKRHRLPNEKRSLDLMGHFVRVAQMNGLRVYIPTLTNIADGEYKVFYSRRGAGPYYCWRYDEKGARWHSSRVNTSDVTAQMFATTSWKTVPMSLQTKLGEHYIE